MSPLIKWTIILLLFFIIVVGLSFVGLVYTAPPIETNQEVSTNISKENIQNTGDDISGQNMVSTPSSPAGTMSVRDSLKNIIKKNTGDYFFLKITVDSLYEQLNIKNALVENQHTQIELLEKQVENAEQKRQFLKELTKTYETMKVTEIRPILEKLDDATIIALYKNMSGRTRKNLINGLSSNRAAQITKQLAGNTP